MNGGDPAEAARCAFWLAFGLLIVSCLLMALLFLMGIALLYGATGRLDVPAYSGRVFLYGSGSQDDLTKPGPTLRIVTRPPLGEVRFRVDGFDYWTHSGSWTTEYTLGPNFGTFSITLDRPGKHTVEVVDIVPADMKTPAGYGAGQRLGQFMDPSNPTKPSAGRKSPYCLGSAVSAATAGRGLAFWL